MSPILLELIEDVLSAARKQDLAGRRRKAKAAFEGETMPPPAGEYTAWLRETDCGGAL
jgi:hypothetical protein